MSLQKAWLRISSKYLIIKEKKIIAREWRVCNQKHRGRTNTIQINKVINKVTFKIFSVYVSLLNLIICKYIFKFLMA